MFTQRGEAMDGAGSRSLLYCDTRTEHAFEPLRVEGKIPVELQGTLFRNGPALFESFGRRYYHLFEGDGAISAVRFGRGLAAGAHRVIQSAGLREEHRAGRPLFGSVAPRLRRIADNLTGRRKNVANTSVLFWQGRLFGLLEAARPMEVSPDDLQTLGEADLDGAVVQTFSAHPHFVAARRAFYNFGMRFGARSAVDLYELPLQAGARRLGSLPLETPTALHDFIATERHLIFFVAPTRLLLRRALLGEARPERLFDWRPERGTEIVVVPIDEPDRRIRFHTDPFFVWHFANAFERDEEILVDFVRHRDVSALGTMRDLATRGGNVVDMNLGEACRASLDLRRGSVQTRALSDLKCEFPTIDGRGAGGPRRFAWLTFTADGARGIARLDLERGEAMTWIPPKGHHVAEPIFAPRPDGAAETDGWVLVLVYNESTRTSHVAVLDAAAPEAGPVGCAGFDHHVPVTLHGTWVAG
jgi:all-trans-8'-apo-beta-carotenal 15,15'-oxygenase